MKLNFFRRVGQPWCVGLVLLVLRLVQNLTGFDPDTGLSLPSLPGVILVALLAVAALYEILRSFRLDKTRAGFSQRFAPPEKEVPFLAVGCFLLIAGGGLTVISGDGGTAGVAAIATGVMAVVSGGAVLFLGRAMRAGGTVSVTPLLPAMFFGVFLVLTVYLPAADDPVLARYYLPVLASAMVAYAFSLLAGFLRGESSPRSFTPVADLAVVTSVATLADGGLSQKLLFGGCAVILSVFLLLQRQVPEAAAPEADAPEAEDSSL